MNSSVFVFFSKLLLIIVYVFVIVKVFCLGRKMLIGFGVEIFML